MRKRGVEREPEFWGPNTWKDEAAFTSGQGGRMGDNDQSSSVRVIPDSIPQTLAKMDPWRRGNWPVPKALGQGLRVTVIWLRGTGQILGLRISSANEGAHSPNFRIAVRHK